MIGGRRKGIWEKARMGTGVRWDEGEGKEGTENGEKAGWGEAGMGIRGIGGATSVATKTSSALFSPQGSFSPEWLIHLNAG